MRYIAATRAVISAIARLWGQLVEDHQPDISDIHCSPIHIRPPLEKAQNHLFIVATSSAEPNQRTGLRSNGFLNTSALRCNESGDICTIVPAGTMYLSIIVWVCNTRGSDAVRGAYRRSDPRMTAPRYGKHPRLRVWAHHPPTSRLVAKEVLQ